MATEHVLGVELDRCDTCGGFWFDDGEVGALAPHLAREQDVPDLDLNIVHEKPKVVRRDEERSCPRCQTTMRTFNYCYNSNIMLDRCGGCSGVWMDGGELQEVVTYVKGNPTLDKLSEAIADEVGTAHRQRASVEDSRTSMRLGGGPGIQVVASVLTAAMDLLFHRR